MENNKLFCYGILKRGYALDFSKYGGKFLGEALIEGATLYGIGALYSSSGVHQGYHGVGLCLTGDDTVAYGELWEVPDELWQWLDHIEGNGHIYERKLIHVDCANLAESPESYEGYTEAWVYEYMHKGFTEKIEGGKF